MVLDATKRAEQRALLEAELDAVGIRLNKEPPYVTGCLTKLMMELIPLTNDLSRNIYLKVKKAGGMKITFQTPPKILDEKIIYNVLRDYKILNCEVLIRDEYGIQMAFLLLSVKYFSNVHCSHY